MVQFFTFFLQTNTAILLGASPDVAKRDMKDVLAFEMKLANVTTPQEKRHDTGAMYTKLTVKELQQQVPKVGVNICNVALLDLNFFCNIEDFS